MNTSQSRRNTNRTATSGIPITPTIRTADAQKFETEVNRIFERNGIAFELKLGEVTRVLTNSLQEALAAVAIFKTGDGKLDEMPKASS